MKTKYIRKEKDYHLLSFEEWEKKYKPIEKSEGNIFFDTHCKKDLKFIKEFQKKNSILNCWTLVDGDDEVYIDSGWRWINRMEYVITEIPRDSKDILVQVEY
jgi:hypothetical protein|nr:hypothetical protein [uncultured Mediterranean phage uvMED]